MLIKTKHVTGEERATTSEARRAMRQTIVTIFSNTNTKTILAVHIRSRVNLSKEPLNI